MTKPERIQLSRARGFDLQAHSVAVNGLPAVNVARPTALGNPFVVGKDGDREQCVAFFDAMMAGYLVLGSTPSVEAQRSARADILARLDTLRGRNLACWCRLDGKPCHADILLRLANA